MASQVQAGVETGLNKTDFGKIILCPALPAETRKRALAPHTTDGAIGISGGVPTRLAPKRALPDPEA